MNEGHIAEILDLERRKLAIQVAATEVAVDDKIKASERRIIDAVTNAVTPVAVGLEAVKIEVDEHGRMLADQGRMLGRILELLETR